MSSESALCIGIWKYFDVLWRSVKLYAHHIIFHNISDIYFVSYNCIKPNRNNQMSFIFSPIFYSTEFPIFFLKKSFPGYLDLFSIIPTFSWSLGLPLFILTITILPTLSNIKVLILITLGMIFSYIEKCGSSMSSNLL